MHSTTRPNRDIRAPSDLAAFIDHTLLKADATLADIDRVCDEAIRHQFKGVCVNSVFIAHVAKRLKGSGVYPVSVVGFPLGAMLAEAKARETELAANAGAKEIDTVIAIGLLKSGEWKRVEEDIRLTVLAADQIPVKVILETGLLTNEEIIQACQVSEAAGARFVKTATGFIGRGATLDDVRLMRKSVSPSVFIKASGGIKTFDQACEMIRNGADRLGTSSGVALVTGTTAGQGY